MKKLFRFFIILLLLSCLIIPAAAEPPPDDEEQTTSEQSDGLKASDFEVPEDDTPSFIEMMFASQQENTEIFIKSIKALLVGSGEFYGYLNTAAITQMLFTIFMPLGLLLLFISSCITLGQKAVDGTLFDEGGGKKGIIDTILPMFIGLILILVGQKLLLLIDTIVQAFTIQTLRLDVDNIIKYTNSITTTTGSRSKVPIVGFFINLFNDIASNVNASFALLLIEICMVIVVVVAGIRIIKLSIYQGFSPVFFGLSGGKETAGYTKNFIVQYCLISFQILVISALLTAMETALVGIFATYESQSVNSSLYMTGGIMCLVFTILIAKSDKLFDKVFR